MDGFIATPDGGIDFLDEFQQTNDDDDDFGFADFMASVDVLVMGRKSFEKVVSFGKDMWAYGTTPVVVWSRGQVAIPEYLAETVTASSLSPRDLFDLLEAQGHKHAYIDGGITMQTFLEAGLIQELKLTRVPILLGEGIPLFSNAGRKIPLNHVETKAYANGMVMLTYHIIRE